MKKMLNYAFTYMIVGLTTGVIYREFTKIMGFTGQTTLSVLHTHTLILGMFMFLIVALFFIKFDLDKDPKFKNFILFYNIGLISTIVMLSVRGTTQVLEMELSKGLNAAISGMSGLAHILITVGIMYLFTCLKKAASSIETK